MGGGAGGALRASGPRALVRRGQRGRSVPPRGTAPGLSSFRSAVFPTPDPAPLRSAVCGLLACLRSSCLTSFLFVSWPPPSGSRPLPLGSPRAAVPCPPPLISHFKAARRGAAAPSAVLRLRMVTPETLLLPFPGHPAPAPPPPGGGSSARLGLRASVPASPPCRALRSPRGSGERSDRESALIKSSCQVIGCDLCPPQPRAQGSCLTLRRPPNSLRGLSLPAPTFSPPVTTGARNPGGESRAGGGGEPPPSAFELFQQGAPLPHLGAWSLHPRTPQPLSSLERSPWIQLQLQRSGARPPQLRLARSGLPAGGVAGCPAPRSRVHSARLGRDGEQARCDPAPRTADVRPQPLCPGPGALSIESPVLGLALRPPPHPPTGAGASNLGPPRRILDPSMGLDPEAVVGVGVGR